MKQWLSEAWYRGSPLLALLLPLSWLFRLLAALRKRRLLAAGPWRADVPVIVVGNIVAGGSGKTPLCLAVARHFTAQGTAVAIVSRGYGGKHRDAALLVTAATDPADAGDEAVLLAQQSGCPVIVDSNRVRAVQFVEQHLQAQLVVCDDGLQHYALARTLEVAVVDGARGLGNQWLLPAGPLRESPARLASVDIVVSNGELQQPLPVQPQRLFTMTLQPVLLSNLRSNERLTLADWQARYGGKPVHAVAGIGNPARFFTSLREYGFDIIQHTFADHHAYEPADLAFAGDDAVVMTAKDAVKCGRFARHHWWTLDVEPVLPAEFYTTLQRLLADQH